MLASAIPTKFQIPWGNAAGGSYIRAIPTTSQIGIQNGAASLADGFPPLCFTPVASGGVPPFGQDMNGILKQITQWNQWQSAGGPVVFDGIFAAAIGGYPAGAILQSAIYPGLMWRSTADNNATDPDDFAAAANWTCVQRWKLSAATSLYVRTDGNNNNTGLSNTSGAAFLTPQFASNFVQKFIDVNNQALTVNLGAGTFATLGVNGPFTGAAGRSGVTFLGAGGTTILSGGIPVAGGDGAAFTVAGMQLSFTTRGVLCQSGAVIGLGSGAGDILINSTGAGSFHIDADSGGMIIAGGDLSIQGNSNAWAAVAGASTLTINGSTITMVGTPAFSNAGVFTQYGYIQLVGNTYVGTSTGLKYSSTYNGMIEGVAGLPGTGTNTQNGGEVI